MLTHVPAAEAIPGVVPPLATFFSENTVGKMCLLSVLQKSFHTSVI